MSDDATIQQIRDIRYRVDQLWTEEHMDCSSIVARYSGSAQQAPIPDSVMTIIDFAIVTYDPYSLVTTGAAWHFTAVIAGYYAVEAMIMFAATDTWADAEVGELDIYKNGGNFSKLDRKDNYGSASSINMALEGGDMVYLAIGDTLDVRVWQSSGAALDLDSNPTYNHVAIWKV
jgi:hypothetical protein